MATRTKSGTRRGARRRTSEPPSARRVERVRRMLLRRGWPRVEMSLILAATGAAGFIASFLMLRLGLSVMWLRYGLAVLLAYGVFLLLLSFWLLLHRRATLSDSWGDALNLTPDDFGGASGVTDATASTFGGGADFAGGGPGGSWDGGVSSGMQSAVPCVDAGGVTLGSVGGGAGGGGGGGGSGGGALSGLDIFDADSEGCVFFLLALALVVAGTLAALYVVYAAPLLLAEILVEGILLSGLYRGMKRARRGGGDWFGAAVRRTWLAVLLTLVTFSAAGYFLQRAAPRARSIGEAWRMVNSDR